jgi:hypothetical protein
MKTVFARFALSFFALLLALGVDAQSWHDKNRYRLVIVEARQAYQQKDYTTSLAKYEEAFQIIDHNRIDLYNAACAASLSKDYNKASKYLMLSIENGYLDKEWLESDKDFQGLRQSKGWKNALKAIDQQIASLEKDFSVLKKLSLYDLVPYTKDGKWGYLNKNNLKPITKAQFHKVFFAGDCLKIEFTEKNYLTVDDRGKISIYRPERSQAFPPPPPASLIYGHPKVDTTTGFKGFRVNDRGRITHVSSIYDETEWVSIDAAGGPDPEIEIKGPLKIKGNWYAVVQLDGRWGVIDESGKSLNTVSFQYEELIPVDAYQGEEAWFYFQDANQKRGFVSSDGAVRLYGEFDSYPFTSLNKMQLARVKKGNKNGVIDLTTIEWLIRPRAENIISINNMYRGSCNKPPVNDRSNVTTFYFLLQDSQNRYYYIDQQEVAYKIEK